MARKYSIPRTLIILVLVIVAAGNIIYYINYFLNRAPHIKYPAFGIDIPAGYAVHGIDVSRYQQVINWKDVREMKVRDIKIGFAFIKATEGLDKVDAQFNRNWVNAEKEQLPRGAYHYFIAGKSGLQQANNFIEIVKLKKGDLPPVVDIEELNNTQVTDLQKQLKIFLQKIEETYRVRPIIYTNIHFYNSALKGPFESYPVWIAHYYQRDRPRIGRQWTFWQHSESGRVNGIQTNVDFNVFNGDSSDFKKLVMQ